MSTDQPVESSKITADIVLEPKITVGSFDVAVIPTGGIYAEKILPGKLSADRIAAGTPALLNLPGHDELRSILHSEGAPPRITLDIGGSDDLDGDGIVTVSLGEDGHELVFEDA